MVRVGMGGQESVTAVARYIPIPDKSTLIAKDWLFHVMFFFLVL